MTIRNLDALLAPKSVALIGASTRAGSVGLITARNMLAAGFGGPVWLVNPKHGAIEGSACHASLEALPGVPDLGIIVTPPATVPGIVAELGAKGARAAVVITAGVRGDLKQAMLDAAKPHTLRIQGANCLGLMVPGIGLNASFCHRAPLAGDLAFVSQSGALITAIVDWAASRGIGFSQIVSLGDMADVDFGDLLDYLAGDAKSRAILLYMESVTQAPKFLSAARRAARTKPVIVVKSGRGAAGARAAMSHTGALAGSDAAYEAAFRRAGLLRVRELDDLFTAAEVLARHPRFTGERLAILTNGGGAGVLAADRLSDQGGRLAELSHAARAALDAVLPPTWSHGNPVDIIGDAEPERYARALDVLLEDEGADAVLVMNCPTALASSTAAAEAVVGTTEKRAEAGRPVKPLLACWLGDEASREARRLFAANSMPGFSTPAAAIDGFMHIVRHARAQEELLRTPPSMPEDLALDTAAAQRTIATALAEGRAVLSEIEAKQLLAAYGIPTVPTERARDPDEVGRLSERWIKEYGACVLKILSRDITHKSDVGGVRLGLEHPEVARRAAEDMASRVASRMPNARIEGFTVQPLIRRRDAHELIVGMSVDEAFGPLILFGAGGTGVEVLRDTAHALPPLDLKLAHDLMRQTRIWRLLQGYRDRPAADLTAIAGVLVRFSYLATRHPEIREIDINPLLADDKGAIALDARVRVEDAARHPRVAPAIRPYPSEWAREVELPMGAVRIRPIRPEDEGLYDAFFAKLTAEDRRMRFFTARPDLSHGFLARLTQIDYAREMAFIALARDTGELLGVARFVADPDYTRGEYAILVRSDLKGQGLGWRLMQHLIDYARAEGLEELYGHVLAENTTMLGMCRQLGFTIAAEPDDPGVRRVRIGLCPG
jgi:acetyltransferase